MRRILFASCFIIMVSLSACGSGVPVTAPPAPADEPSRAVAPSSPYVLVLGTAQDAGLPQIGAHSAMSDAARRDPSLRRLVTSLLIVDPRDGGRWLIDATPDIRAQVELSSGHPASRVVGEGRPALFDAIFLTHAHMGHYAGLLQLGREAYAAERQLVRCSPAMCASLRDNLPWKLLVDLGHVALEDFAGGAPIDLVDGLSITPIAVPHRAEMSDTHGFIVRGPSRSLLYIPDIDKWDRWERRIEEVLAEVDVALLDGTFYADGEIPGRSMAEIPHPFIEESLTRFAALEEAERRKIVFTHLNHTNAAADPDGEAATRIRDAGMRVAQEGEVIPL